MAEMRKLKVNITGKFVSPLPHRTTQIAMPTHRIRAVTKEHSLALWTDLLLTGQGATALKTNT